jgi:nucleoside-diphosphate-sugar epimerase
MSERSDDAPCTAGIVPGGGLATGLTPTLSAVDRLDTPDTTVVTGAAGWLGRALLHAFTDAEARHHRPSSVVAVVATAEQALDVAAVSPAITPVVADVRRPDQVVDAFAGLAGVVDVIHTAGVIHPRTCAEFAAVNADGTRNVVEAASGAHIRRMVHVSSNSPFGTNATNRDTFGTHEPYHPYLGYGRSKMEAELHVFDAVEHGFDAVVVRPPWFYGPWQPPRQTTFFTMVRTGRFPVLGAGDQRRSMVYVDNLVDGVVAAELTPGVAGRGYWIADERPYTVTEIVATVRDALEHAGLPCSNRTLRLPVAAGRVAERIDRLVQSTGRYQQQMHVLGEMAHTIAVDISAARDDLGYHPAVALPEGMRASVAWCLEQGLEL